MRSSSIQNAARTTLILVAASLAGCSGRQRTVAAQPTEGTPTAGLRVSNLTSDEQTIRFLEAKAQNDPDDLIARNRLAELYLLRVRTTGDIAYLNLADRAARESLVTLPPERNIVGLRSLAQVEYASHEFAASRDHALRLIKLDPGESYPYQLLGDALLELGEYDKGEAAYRRMARGENVQGMTQVALEQRLARVHALHGDAEGARRHYAKALAVAVAMPRPSPETIAWCEWQLGETAFGVGKYREAETHYRAALRIYPDYFRALASLGRVRAAQGDMRGATEQFEHATRIVPDPAFIAALGDLYELAGRDQDARAQYTLVEKIGYLNSFNGSLYNRQLALFYADHDLKADIAFESASREYAIRRDIYGADALAWAALKAGKLSTARSAMQEALRLGTSDARFFYHAGMIARACGDTTAARRYLRRALALNPQFDPLQSPIATKALQTLRQ